MSDFIIEDGVLKEYTGEGGDVAIPDGVTEIGWGAFSNCRSLTSIMIPDVVTKIGHFAFTGCTSLQSITIPDSVKSIGASAFSYCKNMESVKLPKGLESIENSTFAGCATLSTIVVPDGVKRIGSEAFYNCGKLCDIRLSDSLTTIGNDAFFNCSGHADEQGFFILNNILYRYDGNGENIVIPDGVVEIGREVFRQKENLKTVTIPDSVRVIGAEAFLGCEKLQSITIPESVEEIGNSAFICCESLTDITLPSCAQMLDPHLFTYDAFYNKSVVLRYLGQHLIIDSVMMKEANDLVLKAPYILANNIKPYAKIPAVYGFADMVQDNEIIDDSVKKSYRRYISGEKQRAKMVEAAAGRLSLLAYMIDENILDISNVMELLSRDNLTSEMKAMLEKYHEKLLLE